MLKLVLGRIASLQRCDLDHVPKTVLRGVNAVDLSFLEAH